MEYIQKYCVSHSCALTMGFIMIIGVFSSAGLSASTSPNLVVNTIGTDITCSGDGNFTSINVNVANTGDADASNAAVRLISDCGLVFSDQTADLTAGEVKDVFFAFTSGISSCSCNFTATIDPDNLIAEFNEADNTQGAGNPPISDLEVQSDTLAVSYVGNGQLVVSGTITLLNSGCGSDLTKAIPMRFTLCDNTECSGNQISQWSQTFSDVSIPSSGGTQTFSVQEHEIAPTPYTDFTDSQLSIFIEADYDQSVCEWDGTNNTLCSLQNVVDNYTFPWWSFWPAILNQNVRQE